MFQIIYTISWEYVQQHTDYLAQNTLVYDVFHMWQMFPTLFNTFYLNTTYVITTLPEYFLKTEYMYNKNSNISTLSD